MSSSQLGIIMNPQWYEDKFFVNYLLKTIESIIYSFK